MRRVLETVRLLVLGAVAAALLAGVPAQASAASTVSSYSVPVTTPDTLGAPVSLDTDVYVPDAAPPPAGFPLLEIFHGGGSTKDNAYDAAHARRFADDGYVVLIYSARGHGDSGGQTTVAGPAEIRDLFDVTAWALGSSGLPHRPRADRPARVLAGRPAHEPRPGVEQRPVDQPLRDLVPRPRAREHARPRLPGACAELRVEALVRGGPGRDLPGRLDDGRIAPVVDKWIAAAAADQPQLYGSGDLCDRSTHDTATSTMQQDLAWRSVGCQPERLGLPWLWAQAFDDGLFTPDMAISMWRRAPNRAQHRLYLSMGGHAAPAADQSVEQDKLDTQRRFLDAVMQGRALPRPNVVYWTRDPDGRGPRRLLRVPGRRVVPADRGQLAAGEGRGRDVSPRRRRQRDAGLREQRADLPLAADRGRAQRPCRSRRALGNAARHVAAVVRAGHEPARLHRELPHAPFSTDKELSGAPFANLSWTPAATDSQLVLELFDEAPFREADALQPRRSGTARRRARSGAAGARRRQRVQHPASGGPSRARLGDGRKPGLLQAVSRLGRRPAADGRRLDADAAAALTAATLSSTHGLPAAGPRREDPHAERRRALLSVRQA